jgi:hypothetical protein
MKNKKSLLKICFMLLTFTFSFQSKAQIIYTNVTDSTIWRTSVNAGTLTYSIDINNDSYDDYNLAVRAQVVNPVGCTIAPATQTNLFAWIGTTPSFSNGVGDSAGFVANILPDSVIGATAPFYWNNSQMNYLYNKSFTYPSCVWDSTIQGYWSDSISGYAALKMKVGAQIFYGWVHLVVVIGADSLGNPMVSATVTDYAYNSAPNQPILAGDSGIVSGINDYNDDRLHFSLFPNPVSNELQVKSSTLEPYQIEVYNLNGKKVFSENAMGLNNKFNTSDLSPGIYFYRITTGKNRYYSGKIIKE